ERRDDRDARPQARAREDECEWRRLRARTSNRRIWRADSCDTLARIEAAQSEARRCGALYRRRRGGRPRRRASMTILKSQASVSSAQFKANAAAMKALVDELKAQMNIAALGGDERSRKRHTERGKLLPRDRVERLVDPGSPFLELSPLAAYG